MKKILCFILAAAMLLTLCACGSGKNASHSVAGYYEIFSVYDGSRTLSSSDLDSMGWNIVLQLNKDGTAALSFNSDSEKEFTWKDGFLYDGDDEFPYMLVDDTLILDYGRGSDTYVMSFKESEPPEESPSFDSVSAKLGGGRVTILSAERFLDYDGKGSVRFYFDYTNKSNALAAPARQLTCVAEEDGVELSSAYASYADDVPEYSNISRYIEPGVTIRCVAEFSYRADGSELRFTISDEKGRELTAVFDPQNLPGRPGDWSPAAVSNPKYFHKYPSEIVSDTAEIAISEIEILESDPSVSSADIVLVSIEYTNRDSTPSYFEAGYSIAAYQDGIELELGTPAVKPDSYGNGYANIMSGDSILVSRSWELLSGSPVEIVVNERQSGDVICANTFSIE